MIKSERVKPVQHVEKNWKEGLIRSFVMPIARVLIIIRNP